MDLRGQTELRLSIDLDSVTNIVTLDIKDDSNVSLGTIIVENIKFKALMKALAFITEERITTLDEQVASKTSYLVQDNSARITFA